jgi:hypothetical protein
MVGTLCLCLRRPTLPLARRGWLGLVASAGLCVRVLCSPACVVCARGLLEFRELPKYKKGTKEVEVAACVVCSLPRVSVLSPGLCASFVSLSVCKVRHPRIFRRFQKPTVDFSLPRLSTATRERGDITRNV